MRNELLEFVFLVILAGGAAFAAYQVVSSIFYLF